jgi:hypothetical protein
MTNTNTTHHGDRSIRRFARHYVEMVAAMFIGMFALGKPADLVLQAFGASSSGHHSTRMAVTMTIPMVAWMRYRGHAWRPTVEMSASMLVPTAAVLGLLWTGVATGMGTLMVLEHTAMLGCMLLAMLVRSDEYSGAHAHGAAQPAIAA